MALLWVDELQTGVYDLDIQNIELFDRLNAFLMAVAYRTGKPLAYNSNDIDMTFKLLEEYMIEYFDNEENFIEEHHYPGKDIHKESHENFKANLCRLKDKFGKSGISSTLTVETELFFKNWLTDHILTEDKAFGDFLQEKI